MADAAVKERQVKLQVANARADGEAERAGRDRPLEVAVDVAGRRAGAGDGAAGGERGRAGREHAGGEAQRAGDRRARRQAEGVRRLVDDQVVESRAGRAADRLGGRAGEGERARRGGEGTVAGPVAGEGDRCRAGIERAAGLVDGEVVEAGAAAQRLRTAAVEGDGVAFVAGLVGAGAGGGSPISSSRPVSAGCSICS